MMPPAGRVFGFVPALRLAVVLNGDRARGGAAHAGEERQCQRTTLIITVIATMSNTILPPKKPYFSRKSRKRARGDLSRKIVQSAKLFHVEHHARVRVRALLRVALGAREIVLPFLPLCDTFPLTHENIHLHPLRPLLETAYRRPAHMPRVSLPEVERRNPSETSRHGERPPVPPLRAPVEILPRKGSEAVSCLLVSALEQAKATQSFARTHGKAEPRQKAKENTQDSLPIQPQGAQKIRLPVKHPEQSRGRKEGWGS